MPFAKSISIRDAGFDEYWLQDQICETPSCLGLGDLEFLTRERQQSSGGRLDILFKNPEDEPPALLAAKQGRSAGQGR